MCAKRTVNERRKQHIQGVWNTLFGCSARIVIHPCTYAHTCATLPCRAFSGNSSGNLSAQTRRSQIGSQCESYRHPYRHPSPLLSPWKQRRQRFFIAWVTVVTVKLHRVGYRHPCHYEQLLTAAVPHKLCKLAAFKNVCGLSYYTDSNVHQRKRAPFRMLSDSIMGKNFQSV